MKELEPTNLAVVVYTALFGSSLAPYLGPYSVIIASASVGASWALGARNKTSGFSAFTYYLRLNMTAILLTVSIAQLVGAWFKIEEPQILLGPIALFIGGVGDRWTSLGPYIVRVYIRWRFRGGHGRTPSDY